MKSKSKYAKWREEWRAKSLEEGFVETKLFLPREEHAKLVEIAQELGERIPVVIGQCVVSYLATLEGKKAKPLDLKPPEIAPTKADLLVLSRMIHKSRFEGDTGAARYRQIAFVNMISAEVTMGNRPTATNLARGVGSNGSQTELLAKVMEARGIIERRHMPGIAGAPSGKVLTIRDDAVDTFNQVHIDTVGSPLLPLD